MTTTATVAASIVMNDGTKNTVVEQIVASIADVVAENGKLELVSLAAATFQALSPPTGSAGVLMKLISGAVTITLKGVTGDTGIVLQSGTLSTVGVLLPLGTTPSIGLLASGTATVQCIWF